MAPPAAVSTTETILRSCLVPAKIEAENQHRLSGKGKTDALETDDSGDDREAVVVNEMGDGGHQAGWDHKTMDGRRRRLPTLIGGFSVMATLHDRAVALTAI